MLWIDTVSGTWGHVSGPQGQLVLVPDPTGAIADQLDVSSDTEITDFGLVNGTSPVLPEETAMPEMKSSTGYILGCNGCSAEFSIPEELDKAKEHDDLEVCHKRGDLESESWRLEEEDS